MINAKFTWIDGITGDTLGQRPHLTIQSPGSYMVYLQDLTNGCFNSDVITVDRPEGPEQIKATVLHPSCTFAADGQILVDTIIGGTTPFVFSLKDRPLTPENNFEGLSPGVYHLTIVDNNGCELEEEFNLRAKSDPRIDLGPDQTIDFGAALTLTAITNIPTSDTATFTWLIEGEEITCQDCFTQQTRPLKNTNYTVTLTTVDGCSVSDEINVKVNQPRRYYIPNAFSPNGDGNNDFFVIAGGSDIKVIKHLSIFNRWGQMVFEQTNIPPNDPSFAWHGSYDGQRCPTGVYVYRAEIEFVDGLLFRIGGDVVLTR